MLAPQKVVAAAPAAVAPAFGSVSDCTSSGALAQNFKVSTNTSDSVSVGDFVALVFDYDLTVVVRSGARDGAGRGAVAGCWAPRLLPMGWVSAPRDPARSAARHTHWTPVPDLRRR